MKTFKEETDVQEQLNSQIETQRDLQSELATEKDEAKKRDIQLKLNIVNAKIEQLKNKASESLNEESANVWIQFKPNFTNKNDYDFVTAHAVQSNLVIRQSDGTIKMLVFSKDLPELKKLIGNSLSIIKEAYIIKNSKAGLFVDGDNSNDTTFVKSFAKKFSSIQDAQKWLDKNTYKGDEDMWQILKESYIGNRADTSYGRGTIIKELGSNKYIVALDKDNKHVELSKNDIEILGEEAPIQKKKFLDTDNNGNPISESLNVGDSVKGLDDGKFIPIDGEVKQLDGLYALIKDYNTGRIMKVLKSQIVKESVSDDYKKGLFQDIDMRVKDKILSQQEAIKLKNAISNAKDNNTAHNILSDYTNINKNPVNESIKVIKSKDIERLQKNPTLVNNPFLYKAMLKSPLFNISASDKKEIETRFNNYASQVGGYDKLLAAEKNKEFTFEKVNEACKINEDSIKDNLQKIKDLKIKTGLKGDALAQAAYEKWGWDVAYLVNDPLSKHLFESKVIKENSILDKLKYSKKASGNEGKYFDWKDSDKAESYAQSLLNKGMLPKLNRSCKGQDCYIIVAESKFNEDTVIKEDYKSNPYDIQPGDYISTHKGGAKLRVKEVKYNNITRNTNLILDNGGYMDAKNAFPVNESLKEENFKVGSWVKEKGRNSTGVVKKIDSKSDLLLVNFDGIEAWWKQAELTLLREDKPISFGENSILTDIRNGKKYKIFMIKDYDVKIKDLQTGYDYLISLNDIGTNFKLNEDYKINEDTYSEYENKIANSIISLVNQLYNGKVNDAGLKTLITKSINASAMSDYLSSKRIYDLVSSKVITEGCMAKKFENMTNAEIASYIFNKPNTKFVGKMKELDEKSISKATKMLKRGLKEDGEIATTTSNVANPTLPMKLKEK